MNSKYQWHTLLKLPLNFLSKYKFRLCSGNPIPASCSKGWQIGPHQSRTRVRPPVRPQRLALPPVHEQKYRIKILYMSACHVLERECGVIMSSEAQEWGRGFALDVLLI
jgi:hypothetical protein